MKTLYPADSSPMTTPGMVSSWEKIHKEHDSDFLHISVVCSAHYNITQYKFLSVMGKVKFGMLHGLTNSLYLFRIPGNFHIPPGYSTCTVTCVPARYDM